MVTVLAYAFILLVEMFFRFSRGLFVVSYILWHRRDSDQQKKYSQEIAPGFGGNHSFFEFRPNPRLAVLFVRPVRNTLIRAYKVPHDDNARIRRGVISLPGSGG